MRLFRRRQQGIDRQMAQLELRQQSRIVDNARQPSWM
jgi:hypothetical protein